MREYLSLGAVSTSPARGSMKLRVPHPRHVLVFVARVGRHEPQK
jgi:hypothetical protein